MTRTFTIEMEDTIVAIRGTVNLIFVTTLIGFVLTLEFGDHSILARILIVIVMTTPILWLSFLASDLYWQVE